MNIDSKGNTIVTGLMSDEHDFDITSKRKTVGVDGWSFKFLAKFNQRQEFLWMKCQGEKTLFHWYNGPAVNTDSSGNIYQCDFGLSKFSPAGKLLWSADAGEGEYSACATNRSGKSMMLSGLQARFIDTNGKTIWSVEDCWCSAATFDQEGNIFVGSQNGITKFSTSGKQLWDINFSSRGSDFGPNGYDHVGAGGDHYVTEQVGLRTDKDNNIVFVFSLNLKNDLEPEDAKSRVLKPGWLQDVAIAKYTSGGKLLWAQKVKIPKTVAKTTRYAEGYDISFMPNGDIIALGGGALNYDTYDSRLFLAKFTTDGEQTRFMWLGEYQSFIHNMGHHIVTNKDGRTYVTSVGEKLPPFLISRDM
jgi:outer membrane protein assembly factor BamB